MYHAWSRIQIMSPAIILITCFLPVNLEAMYPIVPVNSACHKKLVNHLVRASELDSQIVCVSRII